MARLVLNNANARKIFLHHHGLIDTPKGSGRGADLRQLITDLGFVQVDSVNTVARAHDMILWSRQPRYRPKALERLLEPDRAVFEHWTHDASVLPIEHFPHWRKRFADHKEKLRQRWAAGRPDGFVAQIDNVRRQITDHGCCTSRDVGQGEARGSGGWWDWHPSKTALEYLWRTGEVSVVRREGFRKIYDLTERVIPAKQCAQQFETSETIDWACNAALDRLGFATSGELAAFWDLISAAEARHWCIEAFARGNIEEIDVTGADGTLRRSFARPGIADRVASLNKPNTRVRILSPFDPALRDRKRCERLFDFHYRIEIFVPEAKRKYGYYVFPVLQGTRLIGRIDAKADRKNGCLTVTGFWPEKGMRIGAGRVKQLHQEIERLAGLAQCERLDYQTGWLRA